MRLTKDLRFAFTVQSENHGTLHVHTAPISRAIFEEYFAEIKAVFDACFEAGNPLSFITSGPRISYAALKSAATRAGTWKTRPEKNAPTGVEDGLVNELVRLTTVAAAAGGGGWDTLPMATATQREILDEDAYYEILGVLVFFCAASKAGPRELVEEMLTMMESNKVWRFGSWTPTEFVASLRTSKPAESTTKKPSSVIA